MMLTGYTFFTATFVGGWTAVQVEHYRRHAQFHNKLGLVRNYMVILKKKSFDCKNQCKLFFSSHIRIFQKIWKRNYTLSIYHFGRKKAP